MGYEDSVVNHAQLLNENDEVDTLELEKVPLSRRFFTVRSIEHVEILTLHFKDIDLMKKDFKQPSR